MNKISVIVGGKFHAPVLLESLQKIANYEISCFSSSPKFTWKNSTLRDVKLFFIPKYSQILGRILGRDFPRIIKSLDIIQFANIANYAARKSDIIYGFQGCFHESHKYEEND